MKAVIAFFILIVLITGAVLADDIEIIQLRNRLAEEVIPIIKPMLSSNDTISGQGFQLFIRTSDENLEQVRQMISKLDMAAKLLMISVYQGDDRDLRALAVSGGFKYQDSRTEVRLGRSRPSSGDGGNSYSTQNASLGIHALRTNGRLSDHPIHQLRITEGTQGYIETGESIPYFSSGYWHHGHGKHDDIIYGGIEYKDIHTGFYVQPRVYGDQVTMTVSPYKEIKSQQQSGAYKTSGASTKITGPLGQWLLIGGVAKQNQFDHSDMTSVISTRGRESKHVWIKAELVQ